MLGNLSLHIWAICMSIILGMASLFILWLATLFVSVEQSHFLRDRSRYACASSFSFASASALRLLHAVVFGTKSQIKFVVIFFWENC